MSPKSQDEILQWVRLALKEHFNLDPRSVRPDSNLYGDLGLDSIDEIELAQHMQEYTGRRLDANDFHILNTIQDVVDSIHRMLNDETCPPMEVNP